MENVIKQGYLKKAKPANLQLQSASKRLGTSLLQMLDQSRWFVLIVREGKPYLEYYDKEASIFSGQPITKYDLSTCKQITYTLGRTNKNYTFCIVLSERVVELTADSRSEMIEWSAVLERTLRNLGIATMSASEDHVYSDCPAVIGGLRRQTSTSLEDLGPAPATPPALSLLSLDLEPNRPADYEFVYDIKPPVNVNFETDEEIFQTVRDVHRPKEVNLQENSDLNITDQNLMALGGIASKAPKPSYTDMDTSEDDFVTSDFWEKNKRPPLPERVMSMRISGTPPLISNRLLVDHPDTRTRSLIKHVELPPPIPGRPPPSRGKSSPDGFKQASGIPPPLPKRPDAEHLAKLRDISRDMEEMDDGYQSLQSCKHISAGHEHERQMESKHGEKLNVSLPIKETSQDPPESPEKAENFYAPFPGAADDQELEFESSRIISPSSQLLDLDDWPVGTNLSSVSAIAAFQTSLPLSPSTDTCTPCVHASATEKQSPPDNASVPHLSPVLPKRILPSTPDAGEMGEIRLITEAKSQERSSPQQQSPESSDHEDDAYEYQSLFLSRGQSDSKNTDNPGSGLESAYTVPSLSQNGVENAVPPELPTRRPPVPMRQHSINSNNRPVSTPASMFTEEDVEARGIVRKTTLHLSMRQKINPTHAAGTVVALKQSQVEILRSEMSIAGGILTSVKSSWCNQGLALVDCLSGVWIAGWDMKRFPWLYDKFHIGDQLLTVNKTNVITAASGYKLLKGVQSTMVELVVRRLPHAQTYGIRRNEEGESLGIKREGGTAEIVYIDPHGLASQHGLPHKAMLPNGDSCHWCLTEINSRPLNLTFKGNEIEHRLDSVGKDISIVVHPIMFVAELRKQLKKMRNYKDFLVQ